MHARLFLLLILFLGGFSDVYAVHFEQQSPITTLSIGDTLSGGGFRMGRLGPWHYSFEAPKEIKDGVTLESDHTAFFEPSVKLRNLPGWNGYIWMELAFEVDSTLSDRGFYMRYFDHGGAKFWLNGKFIGKSGNPSQTADGEILGPFINPDFFTVSLRKGMNYLLVEYSEHSLPLSFQRVNWHIPNIIFFSPQNWLNLRRERAFVFGGAIMLLILLLLLNLFLWSKFRSEFHRNVILTTGCLLLHALTSMADTLIDLRQSYVILFEPVNAVGFLGVIYFFNRSIRSYYQLSQHWWFNIFSLVGTAVLMSMVFTQRLYLEAVQSAIVGIAIVYGLISLIQAKKNKNGKPVLPIIGGLLITFFGAGLYVFVYIFLGYHAVWTLLLATFLAYTGVPVSLTFATVVDYVALFSELEKKVADRTKELEESLRFRNRFFENVSHEYRTPLTIAQGLLNRIIESQHKDASILQRLVPVKRNVDRLSTMVEQVLALSSIDNNALKLENELLDAEEVVTICVESFRSLAELKHQEIIFLPNAPSVTLFAERTKLESIVNNVLSNAIKYNRKGGVVVVRTDSDGGTFRVTVDDNGPGIDPEEQERIFERFHRIQRNETEYVEGVGIGLELSRTFARAMGGDVTVDPGYRQGARFVIELPIHSEEIKSDAVKENPMPASEVVSAAQVESSYSTGKTKILIVEDNDDMGFYLQEVLAEIGEIHRVDNGKSALEWLEKNTCELIITDLMMPKMDGEKMIDALTQDERWSQIPVVVLSARALEEDRMRLLRYGIVDFISKPFHADELYLRIKNLLEFARTRKQLKQSEMEAPAQDRISEKVAQRIRENLSDSGLSIDLLAADLGVSRRTLYRQLESETGMSLAIFIREIRLQEARVIVSKGSKITLKELAAKVGYLDSANFRRLFVERFGTHPLDEKTG